MAPRVDVRGNAYSAVQLSKRIPTALARLKGHPKCANASTTGVGLINLTTPSGIRKRTTSVLRIRPTHRLFFEALAPALSAAMLGLLRFQLAQIFVQPIEPLFPERNPFLPSLQQWPPRSKAALSPRPPPPAAARPATHEKGLPRRRRTAKTGAAAASHGRGSSRAASDNSLRAHRRRNVAWPDL